LDLIVEWKGVRIGPQAPRKVGTKNGCRGSTQKGVKTKRVRGPKKKKTQPEKECIRFRDDQFLVGQETQRKLGNVNSAWHSDDERKGKCVDQTCQKFKEKYRTCTWRGASKMPTVWGNGMY